MNILRAIMLGLDDESAWRAELHERMLHIEAAANARHRASIAALTNLQLKVNTMSDAQSSLSTTIATLIADNVTLKAAVDSAPAAIATLVATAVAAQVGLGVTPAQLQSLADLHTALGGETTQLQQALAGTAPPPPPPPVVTPPAPPPVPGATDPATGLPVTTPPAPPPV